MEPEPDSKIAMTDWISKTNWTVASGSVPNCVTFQSSLSSLDDQPEEATTPLILRQPSPDSGPCEITINFTEKHELRQVYVRSTARVYEIYYASDLQSNNEYLCTVRCGVAARDGEVLCAPNIQEITSSHVEGSNKELGEENVKNEDEWVEVKVLDTPVLDGRNIPLRGKSYIDSAKGSWDLFEATAEIADANPCISVTLRLLSLQSKGCVYVDEIYAFGDPVVSTDLENQESHNGISSSSSVMAMFLPTLMQLSKTTGLSHINAVKKEKKNFSEDDLEKTHPTDSVIKTHLKEKAGITDPQEVKLKEVNGDRLGLSQPDIPSQVAKMESNHAAIPSQAAKMESDHIVVPSQVTKMENNHSAVPLQVATTKSNCGDSLGGNVEKALEQLLTRMDKIEEICLGFQEKMLMPMSSIEARLQRVEQQLETLTKKFQNSGLPSSSRISAPDASCVESDTDSYDKCPGYTVTREIESDKKDVHRGVLSVPPADFSDSAYTAQLLPGLVVTAPEFPEAEDEDDNASGLDVRIEALSVSPDDMSDSANTAQLLQGLVVTAPEFPDGEDEEDNASVEEMISPNDKGKQNLSIDNALSSALANFLSSLSLESPNYAISLSVKAPEFSNEDKDGDDHERDNASPSTLYEIEKNDSVHLTDSEEINHTQLLTSSDISLASREKLNTDSNDKHSEETAEETEEYGQFCSVEGDQDEVGVNASVVAEDSSMTGFNHKIEDGDRKINGDMSDGLSSNISDISDDLLSNQSTWGSSIPEREVSAVTDLPVATEVPKNAFHEDIIENVLGFSLASSVVDFEIPLLDVKFISRTSPVTDPLIEALLLNAPETNSQDPSVKEICDDLLIKEQTKSNGDVSVEEHPNLLSVDDGELVSTLTSVPVNIEGDNLPEDLEHKRDEISTSSLI